jgi:virginiamycin A acetyltransferase
VAGNSARPIRRRFDDADVDRLLRAARWNGPVEVVTRHARTIMDGTPSEIERLAFDRDRVRG